MKEHTLNILRIEIEAMDSGGLATVAFSRGRAEGLSDVGFAGIFEDGGLVGGEVPPMGCFLWGYAVG